MSRLMSVSLTERAVVERRKTVTRRLGWEWLIPGERLTLCRKVMGRRRKDGTIEPLVRLADVQVIDVIREPLSALTVGDVAREGFSGWTPDEFLDFFCQHMRCDRSAEVTRIEWRYLESAP